MLRNLGVLKYQLAFTSLRCLKQVLGFIKRIPVKYFKAKKKKMQRVFLFLENSWTWAGTFNTQFFVTVHWGMLFIWYDTSSREDFSSSFVFHALIMDKLYNEKSIVVLF